MDKVSNKQIERDKDYLKRVLEWSDIKGKGRIGNLIIGQEELNNLDLNDLREIFNVSGFFDPDGDIPYDHEEDPHMHYVYDVTEEHAKKLRPYIKHQIDLNKYQYFISSHARS